MRSCYFPVEETSFRRKGRRCENVIETLTLLLSARFQLWVFSIYNVLVCNFRVIQYRCSGSCSELSFVYIVNIVISHYLRLLSEMIDRERTSYSILRQKTAGVLSFFIQFLHSLYG